MRLFIFGWVWLVIFVGVDSNFRLYYILFFNRDIMMNNDYLFLKRILFGGMIFENLWSLKSRIRILYRWKV